MKSEIAELNPLAGIWPSRLSPCPLSRNPCLVEHPKPTRLLFEQKRAAIVMNRRSVRLGLMFKLRQASRQIKANVSLQ